MKDLAGKVAIVSGGATLIGAAVVKALRNYGAKLALFDIDAAGGDRLVSAVWLERLFPRKGPVYASSILDH